MTKNHQDTETMSFQRQMNELEAENRRLTLLVEQLEAEQQYPPGTVITHPVQHQTIVSENVDENRPICEIFLES